MEGAIATAIRTRPTPGPAGADRLAEACALRAAGKLDRAEALAEKALRRNADPAVALHLLALIARDRGRLPRALQLLEKAAKAAPDSPAVLCDLGLAYKAAGRLDEAVACQRQVVEWLPGSPMALSNLGSALLAAGRIAEAEAALADAASHDPGQPEIAYNHGNALLAAGRFADAETAFGRALALEPSHRRAALNLGIARKEQGRVEEAIEALSAASHAAPGWAEAEWNLGLALLMAGRWEEGFAAYEARRRLSGFAMRKVDAAPWDGGPLDRRRLLIHAEQGLGDTVQFCRWLPQLDSLDGEVVFQAPAPILPLMRSLGTRARIVSSDESVAADLEAPLMSLPHLTGRPTPFWPDAGRYLAPDAERVRRWRAALAGAESLAVTIHWQGNPNFKGDARRSIPLAAFAPLAELPGARLISLQRGAGHDQIGTVPWGDRLRDLGPSLDGDGAFVDSAAVARAADLVVTSDTGFAHAAAAVGARVWLALCDVPDWRWGTAGETTPWYPTMRLFRQTTPGDWPGVFARIRDALAAEFV